MAADTETRPAASPAADARANDPRPALALLLVATVVTCAAGWLFKAECTFDGQWDNLELYAKGCYSDAFPFWRGHHLADGAIPYLDAPIEYPVLTGLLIFLDQRWTHAIFGSEAGDPAFVFVVSVANTGLALWIMQMLRGLRLSPGRLWAWALAPLLVLYLGHNWDLLAVALAVAAFVAAEKGRPVRACALAALGAAAKLFPVLLLPLIALRRLVAFKIGEVTVLAAVAIAVWAAVNLPVALAAPDNWWEFYKFSSERGGTTAAVWDLATHYQVFITDIPMRNLLSGLAFVAGMGAILHEGWPRYKDRLWLLFTPVLLWFIFTSKVYSPQFDIWVYPFILITARRWEPIALFVLGDIACYFMELWFFAGQLHGWPAVPMESVLCAAVIRAAAMGWLISDALRLPLPAWLEPDGSSPLPVPAPAS
ncbi:MAG: hypothetical protein P0Y56_06575 [Candidatus Andeanibacterium colombiense]|uniref:DUF2029 domain-containing protein n=1 Tax=Candidatus Andeanibacterium colombiense TaxID=3121345 RepID=A0AAJ5XAT6_9SPHN|nr:MAG: hypothetical protein P0Y56_06575 [Sphingomonadaceae bacterium]